MALLVALPAFAQETKDTSSEWAAVAGPALAMPDKASADIKAEIAKSEVLTRELSLKRQAALCDNRAQYEFDAAATAQYIEDWQAALDAIRADALSRMKAEDKAALKSNVGDFKTVGPTTKQFLADIRSGAMPLKQVLDALCTKDTKEEKPQ